MMITIQHSKFPTLSDYTKNFYYKVYGRPIVSRYRKDATAKFGQEFFSKENNYGSPLPVRGFR